MIQSSECPVSRFEPRKAFLALTAALSVSAINAPAFAAPTPHDCAAASEEASALQKQEKLLAAKDRFLACADAACPAEIRDECAHRLSEVTDATPSVVFDVKDASGNDVSAVRVTMDGAPLVDHLGSAAVAIDPGDHTFRFEGADLSQAVEKKFVVRDGEKNRHLAVTLGGVPAAGPGVPAAAPLAASPPPGSEGASASTWSDRKTLAVVAAGVGVIGIGLGAVFGAMTYSQWNSAKTECTATNCGAGSPALSDKSSATTSATIADVGFIAGGVLIAGAAVLWFTAPSGARVQMAPTASAQGAGLMLRGTFE